MLLVASGIGGTIGNIALPGGIASMVAIILVTLIKTRSTDRQALSSEQQEHMDRLVTERREAVTRVVELEDELDTERNKRRKAEDDAARAIRAAEALTERVETLTQEVEALRAEVARLNALVEARQQHRHRPPGGPITAPDGEV